MLQIAKAIESGASRESIVKWAFSVDDIPAAFCEAEAIFTRLSARRGTRAACRKLAIACGKGAEWGSVYCDDALDLVDDLLDDVWPPGAASTDPGNERHNGPGRPTEYCAPALKALALEQRARSARLKRERAQLHGARAARVDAALARERARAVELAR